MILCIYYLNAILPLKLSRYKYFFAPPLYCFHLMLQRWISCLLSDTWKHAKVNKKCWEKAMNCLISPTALCSEHLRHHLPLLWWKLHAIGPQNLALAPRLLNIKQFPLQSCWSLHPHVNESFTSKRSFVSMCVCNVSFQSLICRFCSKHKAHRKLRPWVWISQWC